MINITPIKIKFPDYIQAAVALSYDLEMCAGYAPDGINHGRTIPEIQAYTLKLCEVAEKYDTKLHFFYVCNGLEDENIEYLKEIHRRGHIIDSHTYSHQGIAVVPAQELDQELKKANRLLQERLGIQSTVLRGPCGYKRGDLPIENRQIILENGFKWVSGEFNDEVYQHGFDFWIRAAERDLPYQFHDGLIEIPFQGWSDRMWFDMRPEVDQAVIDTWRITFGHRPVLAGSTPPWQLPNALEKWIELICATLDYTYQNGLLWVPVWHPYTHYLHDPECQALEAFLKCAVSKPQNIPVCTLRDILAWFKPC